MFNATDYVDDVFGLAGKASFYVEFLLSFPRGYTGCFYHEWACRTSFITWAGACVNLKWICICFDEYLFKVRSSSFDYKDLALFDWFEVI